MDSGKNLIQTYRSRWRSLLLLEVMLYALGVGILCWFLTQSIPLSLTIGAVAGIIAYLIIRPWRLSLERVSNHIDQHLDTAEYSSGLLLARPEQLSGLALLQQQKVRERLANDINQVKPETGVKRAAGIALLLSILGFVLFQTGVLQSFQRTKQGMEVDEIVVFQRADSTETAYLPPTLERQRLTINYPDYTQKPGVTSTQMNVKTVEGSRLSWRIDFDTPVAEVVMEGLTTNGRMTTTSAGLNTSFAKAYTPETSGYYNFRFTDTIGASYVSDLYAIEVFKDKAPIIEIKELAKFTTFDYGDTKRLRFQTKISDDFGIGDAYIVATVSKGAGESVKFREERISFDSAISRGSRSFNLSKRLTLDELKMEAGDELYFYVEASDLKEPKANITRSETYFAIIRDTITDDFEVDGTMGADLMPDYFRSQRQLIIDTEKLIKDRPKLSVQEFKSKSNELGFDQKALRLKYGQFMGDEDDSGIAVNVAVTDADDFDEEDPTAGFRHDHDDENEHNIVDHQEEDGEEDEQSPLEEYLHNHDDPEESTLFTESLRSKLQQAMAQMWDAELHLRLANPQTSLPYQYKALKLIQEIKNSARVYVHRIGFDPPPIKEDKRLTGDLEDIDNFYKSDNLAVEDPYLAMRESISILEERLLSPSVLSRDDKVVFAKAGEELAVLAIAAPGKHLKTLQQLKSLTEEKKQPKAMWRTVQRGLLNALPEIDNDPTVTRKYQSRLNKLLIKELETRG